MFGRLKAYFPQDDTQSRDLYRLIYCGSCYALSNSLGFLGRLFLSYELVASFALHFILYHDEIPTVRFYCPFGGIKSRKRFDFDRIKSGQIVDLYLLVLGLKFDDNMEDERYHRKLFSRAGKFIIKNALEESESRLIKSGFPLDSLKSVVLTNGYEIKNPLEDMIWLCGEFFGIIGREIARISNRTDSIEEVSELGRSVGRLIALCDVLDDLSSDLAYTRFNPLIEMYRRAGDDSRAILSNAKDDILYLAEQYLCDLSICLSSLNEIRYPELLKGIFGRSLERGLSKHIKHKMHAGFISEEVAT